MLEYLGKQTLEEVNHLPNIISSVRSVKTDAERRAKNFAVKSAVRTASRKLLEAIEAGAYDFVLKPLHFPQLLISVQRALFLNQVQTENTTLKSLFTEQDFLGLKGVIGNDFICKIEFSTLKSCPLYLAVF